MKRKLQALWVCYQLLDKLVTHGEKGAGSSFLRKINPFLEQLTEVGQFCSEVAFFLASAHQNAHLITVT